MDNSSYNIYISNHDTKDTCAFTVRGWENAISAYETAIEFSFSVDSNAVVDLVSGETGEIIKTTYEG